MGMKDQFQDKAEDLANKAKEKMGQGKDEAGSRGGQQRDEVSERVQREEDGMDQDFDV
ncbi:hypothetical protein [Streptomyces sp. MBT53]|uniref:hypothetical protein n=1 Tax=Streptomyces sp. MBT53 TaxID=1488384 RepID=UPI001913F879|nr:hypothetical protein [Streptomyces sp. MBT53]MBK6018770.1 hypothetical protein [Streptomyces sp. MBT53]